MDHMAFKRRAAYKQRMASAKMRASFLHRSSPSRKFAGPDKWNASVRAELAKMQEQSRWLRENALTASAGMKPH